MAVLQGKPYYCFMKKLYKWISDNIFMTKNLSETSVWIIMAITLRIYFYIFLFLECRPYNIVKSQIVAFLQYI